MVERNHESDASLSWNELFTSTFMKTYTRFDSLEAFLESGGFDGSSEEAIAAIPERELDDYVQSESVFRTWKEMQHVAVTERESQASGG